MKRNTWLVLCVLATMSVAGGDEVKGIDIDFVSIGWVGNPADTGGTAGCGFVDYAYRIGKYEITNVQWNAFLSQSAAPTGSPAGAYDQACYFSDSQQPVNCVSFYEAAQFCNFLTSGDKSLGAYLLGGDGSVAVNREAAVSAYGAVYVVPTEAEWYKAAYCKGNGYSLYANGQGTLPAADNGWNYTNGSHNVPWAVGTGSMEQNGTYDMMGNVWEWCETRVGSGNCVRGGSYRYDAGLPSGFRSSFNSDFESGSVGFRIVAINPEPCSLALFLLTGLFLRNKRK